MKCQILAVGLKNELLSFCKQYFAARSIELREAINISEVVRILEKETVYLLVLDMEYLRSIRQSEWIINIRYVSIIPIIVLSDFPEVDIGSTIKAGADACFNSKLPPSAIALLLSAQLRRYTKYNHLNRPEKAPFQIGDIAIDPCRRLVWVCGQEVALRPREFAMLLYFMRNPNIVLTAEKICKHAWGVGAVTRTASPIQFTYCGRPLNQIPQIPFTSKLYVVWAIALSRIIAKLAKCVRIVLA